MNLLEYMLHTYGESSMEEYEFVDDDKLFVKSGINVLYGRKAVGKTYSLLKYLDSCGIVPVFIDTDRNPKLPFPVHYFRFQPKMLTEIADYTGSSDIIVIDHLAGISGNNYMSEQDSSVIIDALNRLLPATVILLAHSTLQTTATRERETWRGNDSIVNTADRVFRLEPGGNLVFEKARLDDREVIDEWMR
jgi:predicted AAA+ superfamily ATPase